MCGSRLCGEIIIGQDLYFIGDERNACDGFFMIEKVDIGEVKKVF